MMAGLRSKFLHRQLVLSVFVSHADGIARLYVARDNQFGQAVFQVVLDGTLQRTGTKLYVVALRSKEFLAT